MIQRIENTLSISVPAGGLTGATNIEFYVRQGRTLFTYSALVVSDTELSVVIPKADAMKLCHSEVCLQFAFTTAEGTPRASEVVRVSCGELLNEAGYGV